MPFDTALESAFKPTVLILASGLGRRFKASGGFTHKLDALWRGKSVLEHTCAAALASGLPVHVERNQHAGMGDSLAAAVRATPNPYGWLVLPADMPLIPHDLILRVARSLELECAGNGCPIVVPMHEGHRGHPVGFAASLGEALMALHGDVGAKSLLAKHSTHEIDTLGISFAQGCLIDIDTAEDLAGLDRLVG